MQKPRLNWVVWVCGFLFKFEILNLDEHSTLFAFESRANRTLLEIVDWTTGMNHTAGLWSRKMKP